MGLLKKLNRILCSSLHWRKCGYIEIILQIKSFSFIHCFALYTVCYELNLKTGSWDHIIVFLFMVIIFAESYHRPFVRRVNGIFFPYRHNCKILNRVFFIQPSRTRFLRSNSDQSHAVARTDLNKWSLQRYVWSLSQMLPDRYKFVYDFRAFLFVSFRIFVLAVFSWL